MRASRRLLPLWGVLWIALCCASGVGCTHRPAALPDAPLITERGAGVASLGNTPERAIVRVLDRAPLREDTIEAYRALADALHMRGLYAHAAVVRARVWRRVEGARRGADPALRAVGERWRDTLRQDRISAVRGAGAVSAALGLLCKTPALDAPCVRAALDARRAVGRALEPPREDLGDALLTAIQRGQLRHARWLAARVPTTVEGISFLRELALAYHEHDRDVEARVFVRAELLPRLATLDRRDPLTAHEPLIVMARADAALVPAAWREEVLARHAARLQEKLAAHRVKALRMLVEVCAVMPAGRRSGWRLCSSLDNTRLEPDARRRVRARIFTHALAYGDLVLAERVRQRASDADVRHAELMRLTARAVALGQLVRAEWFALQIGPDEERLRMLGRVGEAALRAGDVEQARAITRRLGSAYARLKARRGADDDDESLRVAAGIAWMRLRHTVQGRAGVSMHTRRLWWEGLVRQHEPLEERLAIMDEAAESGVDMRPMLRALVSPAVTSRQVSRRALERAVIVLVARRRFDWLAELLRATTSDAQARWIARQVDPLITSAHVLDTPMRTSGAHALKEPLRAPEIEALLRVFLQAGKIQLITPALRRIRWYDGPDHGEALRAMMLRLWPQLHLPREERETLCTALLHRWIHPPGTRLQPDLARVLALAEQSQATMHLRMARALVLERLAHQEHTPETGKLTARLLDAVEQDTGDSALHGLMRTRAVQVLTSQGACVRADRLTRRFARDTASVWTSSQIERCARAGHVALAWSHATRQRDVLQRAHAMSLVLRLTDRATLLRALR